MKLNWVLDCTLEVHKVLCQQSKNVLGCAVISPSKTPRAVAQLNFCSAVCLRSRVDNKKQTNDGHRIHHL